MKNLTLKQSHEKTVKELSDQQAGQLFKMLFRYAQNGIKKPSGDAEVDMAYGFFIADIDRQKPPKKTEKTDLSFCPEEYLETLTDWLEYKKKRNQSYKNQKSRELFLKQLMNLSGDNPTMAKAIVEQSMANNWSGVFPLKKDSLFRNTPEYSDKIY